ncbi:MAG: alkaline phosphatase D family protein [Bacteroidetes bacterium]|nr:alkaline phosphatase D family protein [Bacteroidota bacterium]
MIRALILSILALSAAVLKAQPQYPDHIYPDTAYAPFYYGVASGDPLQDRIIIWTKVYMPDSIQSPSPVKWQLATDSFFQNVVTDGLATPMREHDYTIKVDVPGLMAGTDYFYRFQTADRHVSQTGRCKTLPGDSVQHVKFAVVSCASVWSGYFNAYRRIAERSDIDFVVHLGDYVYDFADEEELRRMPAVYPVDPSTLAQWRERHTYYLLDPDLRAARQNKTWIAEWDNHDTDINGGDVQEAIRAFYEYLPIRVPDEAHPERIYRQFRFGRLADLDMIDMHLFRGKEQYAPGKGSVLGLQQDAWLKDKLLTSPATWHLIGNQEMMGSWLSEGLPKAFHAPGNGHVFDPGNWDGYPGDRMRLYNFIDSNHISNVVVLTGDAHMTFVIDLAREPKNKQSYDRRTGEGAVGVEFLGPSITRGNMSDRKVVPKGSIPLVQSISRSINPHHRWVNFAKHGYFTLDVTYDRCVAEVWYSPIKMHADSEKFGKGFTVLNGVSHWERAKNGNVKRSTYPGVKK